MKKLWTTFIKDVKLSYSGLYFYIEIGMAVIFLAVMLFVVPENFDKTQTYYAFIEVDEIRDEFDGRIFENDGTRVELFDDREGLEQALSKKRSAVGLHVYMEDSKPVVEFVLQGYEGPEMKQMLKQTVEGGLLAELPTYEDLTTVTVLEPGTERLSDRVSMLPPYLVINVAFMGLFVIAAYVFLDKEEGVIKAFAVTPVKVWHYLASKIMIMAVMGLVTSTLVVVSLVGFNINYLLFFGLILSFNVFGSTLGLLITSFFDSMTKAMGALFLSIFILVFAGFSYFMPSFSPVWIKFLPSYPMFFSFRELFLENGDTGFIIQNILLFLGLSAVLFAYTNLRFKKTLTV